ncbi:head-tail connector protein [Clostridium beijerinckii]|uniref:Phage gp6-like head-tail connector protein n=1 Tax=Clostridium beijerinckii TaxID=1520 RepID=A0AAW3W9D6_CLOBE|nr:head-tail connector protein [Clostridium beijerinckii]MBC2456132.1 phage gp6-like head-tail connector protein [Clostridium beijerinckii]MBC2475417.1 phage gp6-like head-tail connector protein [Clostridium beijerinckii]NOV63474.1 putative phage protein (predicted DNA packaging) [Clostridium beijerinckii]NOV69560.1 putative phage protein (predicted DNA packaging) [Clostridium beijerinckii]NOW31531.1 putative phage protein (predicted DNA packaging) [Clostridium beijerinckii]
MDLSTIKSFLRVDFDDDDELIKLFIEVGKKYITDGFADYDEENLCHRLLLLKSVKTLYDDRDDNNDRVYLSIKLQQFLGDSDE